LLADLYRRQQQPCQAPQVCIVQGKMLRPRQELQGATYYRLLTLLNGYGTLLMKFVPNGGAEINTQDEKHPFLAAPTVGQQSSVSVSESVESQGLPPLLASDRR
jgi:hypothetical protein